MMKKDIMGKGSRGECGRNARLNESTPLTRPLRVHPLPTREGWNFSVAALRRIRGIADWRLEIAENKLEDRPFQRLKPR